MLILRCCLTEMAGDQGKHLIQQPIVFFLIKSQEIGKRRPRERSVWPVQGIMMDFSQFKCLLLLKEALEGIGLADNTAV